MMNANIQEEAVDVWKNTAVDVAKEIAVHSREVDELGVFPIASINLLRTTGLMGIAVPSDYGGPGIPIHAIAEICKIVSGACLSTGMIFSMHLQQVMIIASYAHEGLKKRLLPKIARGEVYVVSVTSDYREPKGQRTTASVLEETDENYVLERHAPTVTGAGYGDVYLITMRDKELNPQLSFVIAEREQVSVNLNGASWASLGMRGTQSCEISLLGSVPKDQVIASSMYDQVCNEVMNPVGHILWASSWLGAVASEFRKFIKIIRSKNYRNNYNLDSDLFAHEIGKIRLKLDIVDTYLHDFISYYTENKEGGAVFSNSYKIKVNNLKIISSEMLHEVMDALVQLGGVKLGYLKNNVTSIERVYRDIRSSRIMLGNENLKMINGKLSFLERL